MKRCPKCNRTYSTDTQKFCTHDGGLLFLVEEELNETVQFDSSKVRDAIIKPTTRDLGEKPPQFDPEETVISSRPPDGTQQVRARDTGSLEPPPQTQYYGAPPSSQPSGPVTPPPPAPAAPVQPPPTSAPLSPPPTASSGPISPPAAQVAAPAQISKPLPPVAPKKKSKLPLILGLVAVLLLFGVGAAAVGGYFLWTRQQRQPAVAAAPSTTEPVSSAPIAPSTPATEASVPSNEPPPYNPPADAVQFVNSQDGLSGRLAENFVAFSFYYPNRWVKLPTKENFVTVERRLPPDFTQERFGVAPWYAPSETTTFDDAFFQTLVAKDDANFAKNYPEYRKVSEGPTRIGSYDGYELRFESTSRGTDKGDLTLWGREIFFPPREGEKVGVKLLILTTSLAPELRSIDDVGAKGELPMLLESFRFGK